MRRSGFKGLVAAGLVATGIAATTSIVSASDMFLKLGTIKGESTDDKHKGEIDVLSWSWGTSDGTATAKKGKLPTACIQDLTLTKFVDTASPALIMMAVAGGVVPDATLTVRKSGGEQAEYLTLRFTNVSVPSYETGGDTSENRLTETVMLHFDSLQGDYRPQSADGKLGNAVVFNVSGACP